MYLHILLFLTTFLSLLSYTTACLTLTGWFDGGNYFDITVQDNGQTICHMAGDRTWWGEEQNIGLWCQTGWPNYRATIDYHLQKLQFHREWFDSGSLQVNR
jgi:hypothetical protein